MIFLTSNYFYYKMQVIAFTLSRGTRSLVPKFYFRPKLITYKPYQYFCNKNQDNQSAPNKENNDKDDKDDIDKENIDKENNDKEEKVEIKATDGEIFKSTVKEVIFIIKETVYEKAVSFKDKITKDAKSLNEGANADKDVTKAQSALNIMKHAWKKTFPSQDEQARDRMEKIKERFAEQKKEEERLKEFTEEELSNIQAEIPEWKRTSLQESSEGVMQKPGLRRQVSSKIANQLSKTEFAQRIKGTEEFKEYNTFKSEMSQFKEDVKEKVQNHPSNVVQGSIYKKVTMETDIAKAIKQMRLIDPEFDLFQLELDAKIIFENIYSQYLRGELSELEKVCGEMALGYFKVLLKKREVEKSEPKYKYLWNIEPAFFSKAFVTDTSKLPVFVFTIKAQEIYCYISKVTTTHYKKVDHKKIIDGDDERVMSMDYMFALTPHLSPSLEQSGHSWEMIELQPREIVKMLV